jgi:hypothetical protein
MKRAGMPHFIAIGKLLLEAKQQLKHGDTIVAVTSAAASRALCSRRPS